MKKGRMNGIKSTMVMAVMAIVFIVGGISAEAADVSIDGGATKTTAARIDYNYSYVAQFEGGSNNDWYVFKPTGTNDFYEIEIKNFNIETNNDDDYGFHAYIMNQAGDVYADIATGENQQTVTKVKLRNITEDLYIKFELGAGFLEDNSVLNSGNYRISIKTVKDDCGDTMNTATPILSRKTYTKKMDDWCDFDAAVINEKNGMWIQNHDGNSDVDFFRFKAPKTGYYTVRLKNNNIPTGRNEWDNLNAQVLSGYEEELAKVDCEEKATQECKVKLKKNQTYYIKVNLGTLNAKNIGTYKLSVYDNDYLSSLKAPEKVKASVSGKKVKVTWKKNNAVKDYMVYRSVNGQSFKKVATVKNASYIDKKVAKGKKYQYKIVANSMKDKTKVLSKAKATKSKRVSVK